MSKLTAKQFILYRLNQYGLLDFIKGLETLSDREKQIVERLDFDLATIEQVSDETGLTWARVQYFFKKARRKIWVTLAGYYKLVEENVSLKSENKLLRYKINKLEGLLVEQGKPVPSVLDIDATELENIDMSVRLYNSLKMGKINTVGQIKELGNEVLKWRNFGKNSYIELREHMDELGIKWPVNQPRLY